MKKTLLSRLRRRGNPLPTAVADTGWLPSGAGFIGAAWYAPRGPRPRSAAVLIVPGIAHEERTMIDGLAALARSLAASGFGSLLIDLHGTAQSSGRLDVADIGERWQQDIRSALAHLRDGGFDQVFVVGVRIGALLAQAALKDEAGEALAGFLAWAPVLSGRRYARELKMLKASGAAGGCGDAGAAPGSVSVAGHDIPKEVLAHLGRLTFDASADATLAPMLVLGDGDAAGPDGAGPGRTTEHRVATQVQRWLFCPDDTQIIPHDDIRTLVGWCCERERPAGPAPTRPTRRRPAILKQISLACDGLAVRERTVRFGRAGLSGIVSEPLGRHATGAARLLATVVGPGRLFPTLAREQAGLGKTSMRFDFAGFGASGLRPDRSGGELYSSRNRDDVAEAVAYVLGLGHRQVAMVGFCAGAWSMIHAGPLPGVSGIAGINVQMFRQPDYLLRDLALGRGHPVAKALALLRRLTPLARTVERLERRLPIRLETGRWLQRLGESATRPLLVYSTDDVGLVHLDRRFGRRDVERRAVARGGRPAGDRIAVGRYPGLGHLLEGSMARTRALEAVVDYLAEVDARAPTVAAPLPVVAPKRTPPVRADRPATDTGWDALGWAHSR